MQEKWVSLLLHAIHSNRWGIHKNHAHLSFHDLQSSAILFDTMTVGV